MLECRRTGCIGGVVLSGSNGKDTSGNGLIYDLGRTIYESLLFPSFCF